jgi:hypothetical protein
MKWSIFTLLAIVILIQGCYEQKNHEPALPPTDTISSSYKIIADTINYGIVVKNRDTTNRWQQKWLSHLDKDSLVDRIFEAVYARELKPYNYFTGEKIPLRKIRKLEKSQGFDRSSIGKLQFEEIWYFDPSRLRMVKSVNSIMLAYEVYRQDSTFRGYKPAFKVYLNKPFN